MTTTFRPELIATANKCYGVTHARKVGRRWCLRTRPHARRPRPHARRPLAHARPLNAAPAQWRHGTTMAAPRFRLALCSLTRPLLRHTVGRHPRSAALSQRRRSASSPRTRTASASTLASRSEKATAAHAFCPAGRAKGVDFNRGLCVFHFRRRCHNAGAAATGHPLTEGPREAICGLLTLTAPLRRLKAGNSCSGESKAEEVSTQCAVWCPPRPV